MRPVKSLIFGPRGNCQGVALAQNWLKGTVRFCVGTRVLSTSVMTTEHLSFLRPKNPDLMNQ